jgi:hypothetical protein
MALTNGYDINKQERKTCVLMSRDGVPKLGNEYKILEDEK